MPTSELIVRLTIPAILVVAVVGVFLALWWEARHPSSYPGSRRHAGDVNLAWWRSLSTAEQGRRDAEAIAEGMLADGFDQAVRARAEESARLAVQRAADINAQFHP